MTFVNENEQNRVTNKLINSKIKLKSNTIYNVIGVFFDNFALLIVLESRKKIEFLKDNNELICRKINGKRANKGILFFLNNPISARKSWVIFQNNRKMMTIKKIEKQQYLAPAIAVFDIVENTYLLAASPNARPGGDGDPAGSITIEPPKHEDGGDSDNLEG